MSQYFPKPFRNFGGNINVKVDLSNYATKTVLKNVTQVHVSNFTLKTNLASLKTEVDKLDIDKLAPVPVDLSKFSDVVKNDVVRKAVYDKLAAKVDNIDTSDFVLKAKYQTDKTEFEQKIPDLTDYVKKTKLSGSLETKTALTAMKNIIASVSSLVKTNKQTKITDYGTNISELENKLTDYDHDKYITTLELNTLATNVVSTSRFSNKNKL